MENLSPEELRITALGPATFPSPLGLSTVYGDGVANYVQETESVLYIAANAALALNDGNYVLVPEVPFDLEGPRGLFRVLEERLRRKRHAVIVVAKGAGQRYVAPPDAQRDESGKPLLGDIGGFLKTRIKAYFRERTDLYVCMRLAQNAVHAGMAGKTGMLVGYWNDEITHVPLALAAARCKRLSPEDSLWLNVLEATGQPISLCNDLPAGGNT